MWSVLKSLIHSTTINMRFSLIIVDSLYPWLSLLNWFSSLWMGLLFLNFHWSLNSIRLVSLSLTWLHTRGTSIHTVHVFLLKEKGSWLIILIYSCTSVIVGFPPRYWCRSVWFEFSLRFGCEWMGVGDWKYQVPTLASIEV